MITALVTFGVLLTLMVIVTAIRSWKTPERPLLYVLIPCLLAFSLYTGDAIYRLLGFPTRDLADLHGEFQYLWHANSDPVFLLAVPDGAAEPRLYAIPRDQLTEKEREGLSEAGAKAKKQVEMMGRFSEGEFHFYDFRAEQLPPKE